MNEVKPSVSYYRLNAQCGSPRHRLQTLKPHREGKLTRGGKHLSDPNFASPRVGRGCCQGIHQWQLPPVIIRFLCYENCLLRGASLLKVYRFSDEQIVWPPSDNRCSLNELLLAPGRDKFYALTHQHMISLHHARNFVRLQRPFLLAGNFFLVTMFFQRLCNRLRRLLWMAPARSLCGRCLRAQQDVCVNRDRTFV